MNAVALRKAYLNRHDHSLRLLSAHASVSYMKVTTLATFHAPMSVLIVGEVWNIDHLQDRYHYSMIIIMIILPTIVMLRHTAVGRRNVTYC